MNLCEIKETIYFILVKLTMDKIEILTFLKHYWKQNYSASAAVRKICEVEGEDVVTSRIAQR